MPGLAAGLAYPTMMATPASTWRWSLPASWARSPALRFSITGTSARTGFPRQHRNRLRSVRFVLLWFALPACSGISGNAENQSPDVVQTGTLQNAAIGEASGLARSNLSEDLLWVINDGGSAPVLHAIGTDGSDRGSVRLMNAVNVDWEDLASFEAGGKSWLLVADVGDNAGTREHVSLYLVEEPVLPPGGPVPARQIRFAYPDGPRDAEAVAVDVENQQVMILSKRTIPAALYAVPLQDSEGEATIAVRLGEVAGIPQPGAEDLEQALANNDWHWQPTGMDISAEGMSAVILSYRAIYRFRRNAGESWIAALQAAPTVHSLGNIREAEAVSFDISGLGVFVTVEQRQAPLYWFEIAR